MNKDALVKRYRIEHGKKFHLDDFDPDDTAKLKSKEHCHERLEAGVKRLSELQSLLYAQNKWSLLLIFQAMDAAGKDGTIKHVMSGVNPQGCQVFSFKVPSEEDLNHDFLWRSTKCLPERGRIGIFNRSYYEEVLVVRVHSDLLDRQKMPSSLVTKKLWQERFQDIAGFERYLTHNGVVIRKFFLHLSKHEQKQRLLCRLQHTATEYAPWYIIPADHKWFTRLVVAEIIVKTLESLSLTYPEVSPAKKKELAAVRKSLSAKHAD
jgi:PPK2 family polyphosphate:nucleotide phosphotransferase